MQFKLSYEKSITLETSETFYLIKCFPKIWSLTSGKEIWKLGLHQCSENKVTPATYLRASSSLLTFSSKTRPWVSKGEKKGTGNVTKSSTSGTLKGKDNVGEAREMHMMPDKTPQLPSPGRPLYGAHTSPAPSQPSHPHPPRRYTGLSSAEN